MKKLLLAVVVWLATLSAALAQGTVLQGGPWAPGHQPMYVGPNGFGGQTIVQDGGGSAGGPLGVNPSEIGITSRSPTGSYPSANSGNGPNYEHGCFYDGPTTGAYHYLCLDADALGGGLLSYGAEGGASPLPLQFYVNGSLFSPSGTALVAGSTIVTGGPGVLQNSMNGGTLVVSPTISITGVTVTPPNGFNTGIDLNQIITGTASGAFNANKFDCSSTSVNTGSSSNAIWCLSVDNASGSGVVGSTGGALFTTELNSPTSNGAGGAFANAFGTLATANSGDGGYGTTLASSYTTGATVLNVASSGIIKNGAYVDVVLDNGLPQSTVVTNVSGNTITIAPGLYGNASSGNSFYANKGVIDGGIIQSEIGTGGTYLVAAIGGTATVYAAGGNPPLFRKGFDVELDVPSVAGAQGLIVDQAIGVSGQVGALSPFLVGLQFDDSGGVYPISQTGTLIKAGSVYSNSSGTRDFESIGTVIDTSGLAVTGNFATWSSSTGLPYSITGAGFANLSSSQMKRHYPEMDLYDTEVSGCTTGNLQRMSADGLGNVVWQINTDAGCAFGAGFTVFKIEASGNVMFNGQMLTAASTTASAGLNIGQGAAPTSPANGDVWMTSSGLYYRFNGTTHGPL